eukprot:1159130-Pelagomonas_calceolata.AAC.23
MELLAIDIKCVSLPLDYVPSDMIDYNVCPKGANSPPSPQSCPWMCSVVKGGGEHKMRKSQLSTALQSLRPSFSPTPQKFCNSVTLHRVEIVTILHEIQHSLKYIASGPDLCLNCDKDHRVPNLPECGLRVRLNWDRDIRVPEFCSIFNPRMRLIWDRGSKEPDCRSLVCGFIIMRLSWDRGFWMPTPVDM